MPSSQSHVSRKTFILHLPGIHCHPFYRVSLSITAIVIAFRVNVNYRFLQDQSKEVRLSLFSMQSNENFVAQSHCSWVTIQSIHSLAPFTSELVLMISPIETSGIQHCQIAVNSTFIPVTVEMGGRTTKPILHWIEGERGNVFSSNGDSAFTNYRSLYNSLLPSFLIHLHPTLMLKQSVCLCFDVCKQECLHPIYIVGLDKTRSVLLQQEMKTRYHFITTRHGKSSSVIFSNRKFDHVLFKFVFYC